MKRRFSIFIASIVLFFSINSDINVYGENNLIDDKQINKYSMLKYNKFKQDYKITYNPVNETHQNYVKSQDGSLHIIYKNGSFINASLEEVSLFSEPNANLSESEMYQYLRLDKFRYIDETKLNNELNSIKVEPGNVNVFENQANNFIKSSQKYSIDPLYLVSHMMLETGKGQSRLAQGNDVVLDENGNAIYYEVNVNGKMKKFVKIRDKDTPKDAKTIKVYNFFGIGAIDGYAIAGGVTTAYENGWTSIGKTIDGSAKWISDRYINSSKYNYQYNLYSMKWDYVNKWHQYATDVQWPTKIASLIESRAYMYLNNCLELEIPLYKDKAGWIRQFDGNYVYADKGKLQKGWLNLDDSYYMDEDGIMTRGWKYIDNKWYYFYESGRMAVNTSIGNWTIDNNGIATLKSGVWKLEDGSWYYIKSNGEKTTGWLDIDGNWYYFKNDGKMVTGLEKIGDFWYYFEESGYMATGWKSINNNWYYFYESGEMATNTSIGNWIIDSNGIANIK